MRPHQGAALDDDSRRSIYDFVAATAAPVTREQVAHAVGISPKLAAFHLDKLVAAGLLVTRTDTARTRGTRGGTPGTYEQSSQDVTVALPARRPEVLAEMLPRGDHHERTRRNRARSLHARGRTAWPRGGDAHTRTRLRGGRLGAQRALTLAKLALRERGYEPAHE